MRSNVTIAFQRLGLCAATIALGLLAGCGDSSKPELGTVSGTVTLNGRPLEGATVTFQHSQKRFSRGTTDANGRYELNYIRDIQGAAIGKHRVVIRCKGPDRREIVPSRYNEQTRLEAEVKPGHNTLDFNLS